MRLPTGLPLPSLAAGPDEDEWGYDPDFARAAEPWLDFLYTRWWRVQSTGVQNIPPTGPALIVANHAGTVPWDAAMMATAIRREAPPSSFSTAESGEAGGDASDRASDPNADTSASDRSSGGRSRPEPEAEGGPQEDRSRSADPQCPSPQPAHGPRHPRFLVLDWAFTLPYASIAIRRFGGVPASPHNALALLRQGHVVMVFPEGAKGVGKPYRRRYRLERFGRGGFVALALRAGAPIIPCAVVGSEEIYPKLGEVPLLGRLTGAPYVPITPTFPLLGALGAIPLPSRWRIAFDEPIDLGGAGPDAADDPARVFELSDEVRERIQAKVFENLVKRKRAF